MSFAHPTYNPGPCQVCGKPGGAFMGKSTWSWGGLACSDACGEAASAAVDRVRETPRYKRLVQLKWNTEQTMARMKANAVRGVTPAVSSKER